MADGLVEELLGEALVAALRDLRQALGSASEETLTWLRNAAHPPPNLRLISDDGSTFSGMVLVERSDVVVMLAARHTPVFSSSPRPEPSPARQRGLSLPDRLDPDDPVWDRDVNPYHR